MAGAMEGVSLPTPELVKEQAPAEEQTPVSLLQMDKGGSHSNLHTLSEVAMPKRERRRSVTAVDHAELEPPPDHPMGTLQPTLNSGNDWKALSNDFEELEIQRAASGSSGGGKFGGVGSSPIRAGAGPGMTGSSGFSPISPNMRPASSNEEGELGELYEIGENAADLPAYHEELPASALEHEMASGFRRVPSSERPRRKSVTSSIPIGGISEDKELENEELPLDTLTQDDGAKTLK